MQFLKQGFVKFSLIIDSLLYLLATSKEEHYKSSNLPAELAYLQYI